MCTHSRREANSSSKLPSQGACFPCRNWVIKSKEWWYFSLQRRPFRILIYSLRFLTHQEVYYCGRRWEVFRAHFVFREVGWKLYSRARVIKRSVKGMLGFEFHTYLPNLACIRHIWSHVRKVDLFHFCSTSFKFMEFWTSHSMHSTCIYNIFTIFRHMEPT